MSKIKIKITSIVWKLHLKKQLNGVCKFLSPKLAQSRWEKIPNQHASISGVEQQEDPTNNAKGAKQHMKNKEKRYLNLEEPCNNRRNNKNN
jgi:hypothetical protein